MASDGDYRIRILNALSKLITNCFSWQIYLPHNNSHDARRGFVLSRLNLPRHARSIGSARSEQARLAPRAAGSDPDRAAARRGRERRQRSGGREGRRWARFAATGQVSSATRPLGAMALSRPMSYVDFAMHDLDMVIDVDQAVTARMLHLNPRVRRRPSGRNAKALQEAVDRCF